MGSTPRTVSAEVEVEPGRTETVELCWLTEPVYHVPPGDDEYDDGIRYVGDAAANGLLMAAALDGLALAKAVAELISPDGELNLRTSDYRLADLRRLADVFLAKTEGR
jgi:hypothetical protein